MLRHLICDAGNQTPIDPFSQSGQVDLFSGLNVSEAEIASPTLSDHAPQQEAGNQTGVVSTNAGDPAMPAQGYGSGLDLLGLDLDTAAPLASPANGRYSA